MKRLDMLSGARSLSSRRVLWGLAANGLGKVWVLLSQLALIPLLTHHWGAAGYGRWLMFTTVPTYLALFDFGIGTTVAVEMTKRLAEGDRDGARRAFQSAWLFIFITLGIAGVVGGAASLAWLAQHPDAKRGIITLATAVVLSVYGGLILLTYVATAGFRATGRYATSTFVVDLALPVETAAVCAVVLARGEPLHAAIALCTTRLVGLLAFCTLHTVQLNWLPIGFKDASLSEVRKLAKPSLGALALALASAIGLQGVVLTIGTFMSPAAAGLFGAARTITRVPLQLSSLASRAAGPELAIASAAGNTRAFNRLMTLINLGTFCVVAPAAIAITLFGPTLLLKLSSGELHSSYMLMGGLACAMVAQAMWTSDSTGLVAKNRQHLIAPIYLPLSVIVVAAPAAVSLGATVEHVAVCYALCEFVMLGWTISVARMRRRAASVGATPS